MVNVEFWLLVGLEIAATEKDIIKMLIDSGRSTKKPKQLIRILLFFNLKLKSFCKIVSFFYLYFIN